MSDQRGGFLVCPACNGQLVEIRVGEEQVAIDRCMTCQGVWFDFFDGEASALARHVTVLPLGGFEHAAPGACPRDGAQLTAQPYLDAHGPVVERCPSCLGLFARRERIAALRDFHERMPDPIPPMLLHSIWARLWRLICG